MSVQDLYVVCEYLEMANSPLHALFVASPLSPAAVVVRYFDSLSQLLFHLRRFQALQHALYPEKWILMSTSE